MLLISAIDPEEVVQEQALAFVRNLVYGSVESVQQVFIEDGLILRAVVQQLRNATGPEVCTQVCISFMLYILFILYFSVEFLLCLVSRFQEFIMKFI